MKVLLRVVGVVLVVLVLVFVAAAIILPRVLKPAVYETRIEALVLQRTGRTLTIHGRVGLSFFPWLGVRLHQVALSNPQGFTPGTFASIRKAEVRVKLLPLLHRQVEVSKISLDGLTLNLVTNAAGQKSWAGLAGPPTHTAAPAPAPGASPPLAQALSVAGLEVTDSDILWSNLQTGQRINLRAVKLTVGRIAAGHAVPINLYAKLQVARPALVTTVKLKAQVTWTATQTVVRHVRLSVAGVAIKARATIKTTPVLHLAGGIMVPDMNLRKLLTRLGMAPTFRDPQALTRVSIKARFAGTPDKIELTPLAVTLDQSHIQGRAALQTVGASSHYQIALSVDHINLDHYRSPATGAAGVARAGPQAQPKASPLPTKALRGLNVDGALHIAQLTAFGMHLQQVVVTLGAHQGLVRLAPLSAGLYGGSFNGTLQYDARGPSPVVAVTEHLNQVAVGPMLRDARVFDKFEGTGNIDGTITASGLTTEAMTRTLNGSAHIALVHGQIKGVNLGQIVGQIEDVRAAFRGQAPAPSQPQAGDHTDFSSLTATAQIANGVVHNQDLALAAPPLLNATGQGLVDLVHKSLSYALVLAGQAGGRAFQIPVHVSGPFGGLSWRADLRSALRGQAQQQLKKQGDRLKSRLQQDLNQRLQNLLH